MPANIKDNLNRALGVKKRPLPDDDGDDAEPADEEEAEEGTDEELEADEAEPAAAPVAAQRRPGPGRPPVRQAMQTPRMAAPPVQSQPAAPQAPRPPTQEEQYVNAVRVLLMNNNAIETYDVQILRTGMAMGAI